MLLSWFDRRVGDILPTITIEENKGTVVVKEVKSRGLRERVDVRVLVEVKLRVRVVVW